MWRMVNDVERGIGDAEVIVSRTTQYGSVKSCPCGHVGSHVYARYCHSLWLQSLGRTTRQGNRRDGA